jgi:hypothetical protein
MEPSVSILGKHYHCFRKNSLNITSEQAEITVWKQVMTNRRKKTPADEDEAIHRGEPKGEVYNVK